MPVQHVLEDPAQIAQRPVTTRETVDQGAIEWLLLCCANVPILLTEARLFLKPEHFFPNEVEFRLVFEALCYSHDNYGGVTFETLKEKDADRATTIDPHNKRRIVRALEIVEALGKVPQQKKKPEKHVLWIGIEVDAETLRTRIAKRLTERMDQGMIEEVAALHASGTSWEKLESFGLEYRFIARYLQKNICKEEMLEKLRFAINGYARRQRTWFRKHDDIHWVQSSEEASRLIDSFIATP